nr:DUF3182 family protein [Bradyrhizobium sp. WSM1743]
MDRPIFPHLLQHRSRHAQPSAVREIGREQHGIGAVACLFPRLGAPMYTHEKVTLSAVAESIARLKGCRFVGEYDPKAHMAAGLFFVPSDTLMLEEARDLGIQSPHQLYGAVVPQDESHHASPCRQACGPAARLVICLRRRCP